MENQQREAYWMGCLILFFLERDFISEVALGLIELVLVVSFN